MIQIINHISSLHYPLKKVKNYGDTLVQLLVNSISSCIPLPFVYFIRATFMFTFILSFFQKEKEKKREYESHCLDRKRSGGSFTSLAPAEINTLNKYQLQSNH